MGHCPVCHDFQKKDDSVRFVVDFTPNLLQNQALEEGCVICRGLLGILTQAAQLSSGQPGRLGDPLIDKISRVYLYGPTVPNDTMSMELYMNDDTPKSTIELYYSEDDGALT